MAKAEIKTVKNKASVKAYLDAIQDPKRKRDCLELSKMMQETTGDKPAMWGDSIVGFGTQKMKYATGREVEWMQCGFSSRKDSISIYMTCNLDELAPYLEELGKHKRGAGCLYIKTLDDIKIPVLKKMLKAAVKNSKSANI